MQRFTQLGAVSLLFVIASTFVLAAPEGSVERMDYGPVIGASYGFDSIDTSAERGLAIRLPGDAVAVFDTALLKYVKVTKNGAVDLSNTDFMKKKGGQGLPTVTGEPHFWNETGAGITSGSDWSDPRSKNAGLMPRSWGRFKGYYQHGRRIVLSYSAGEASVLDHPWVVRSNGQSGLVRHMLVKNLQSPVEVRLFDSAGATVKNRGSNWCILQRDKTRMGVAVIGAPNRTSIVPRENGPASVKVEPGGGPASFRVVCTRFSDEVENAETTLSGLAGATPGNVDLRDLTTGGPSNWNKTLSRKGSPVRTESGYVSDEIPVPKENPWNAFIRISGLDFFESGQAAVCTMNGDVWLVSGLEESLKNVQWKRFATGLYNPLGLSIRNGSVFVLEQGQITKLQDLNGDYEADFYQRFNADGPLVPNAYWMTLEHDSQGRFYYLRSGHRAQGSPHQARYGSLMQVSADGRNSQIYAYGFRQANGLGINPDDQIQTSDQEGNWMPATRIDRVQQGKFYGYKPNAPEDYSGEGYAKPISWLPRGADHSGGGEVFAHDRRWGPLSNHWVHLSWGQARIFVELHEKVNGQLQGGAVKIPVEQFKAGLMRGAVGPHDGQVYVAGVGVPGWTSVSRTVNTFNRIRYTGEPAHMPVQLRTSKEGVRLMFSDPLDKEAAADPENYTVKRWKYRYNKSYGSDEYSIEHPDKTGRDDVEVSEVKVNEKGTGVILRIPDMKPVQQMMVKYKLNGKNGESINNRVLFTIHELK